MIVCVRREGVIESLPVNVMRMLGKLPYTEARKSELSRYGMDYSLQHLLIGLLNRSPDFCAPKIICEARSDACRGPVLLFHPLHARHLSTA
jgi:hypothetical protein